MNQPIPIENRCYAWCVHIFTASGVMWAMLAVLALLDGKPLMCMLWLSIALVVDGVDGTLARKAHVKEITPNFDGAILDLIIDYLTYVFIPALFIYLHIALPENLGHLSIAIILISSLYCFCNVHMKSNDNYFVGFPAAWNIVALYFYILPSPAWLNFAVILFLAALTVTKIKFLHPFRVKTLMALNLTVCSIWLITSIWLVVYAQPYNLVVYALWWFSSIYFLGICGWRSWQDWKQ